MHSDYLRERFLRHIDKDSIDTIFEIGSRDAVDAILLRDAFDARVYAFECNPEALAVCRENLKDEHDIRLVENAAWCENGPIRFYPVIETLVEGQRIPTNIGASSCFRARSDYHQRNIQTEIVVEAIRLDDFCRAEQLTRVDLVCMDVQGAALQVLQGMSETIEKTRYLISELEQKEIYHHQSLFPEVCQFLTAKGFRLTEEAARDGWFSDYMFIRDY